MENKMTEEKRLIKEIKDLVGKDYFGKISASNGEEFDRLEKLGYVGWLKKIKENLIFIQETFLKKPEPAPIKTKTQKLSLLKSIKSLFKPSPKKLSIEELKIKSSTEELVSLLEKFEKKEGKEKFLVTLYLQDFKKELELNKKITLLRKINSSDSLINDTDLKLKILIQRLYWKDSEPKKPTRSHSEGLISKKILAKREGAKLSKSLPYHFQ